MENLGGEGKGALLSKFQKILLPSSFYVSYVFFFNPPLVLSFLFALI